MRTVKLTIDQLVLEVPVGTTILEAARKADIYIPSLCSHPDLPPASGSPAVQAVFQGDRQIENVASGEGGKGCGICVVEVAGEDDLVDSCAMEVEDGMIVVTNNERIRAKRKENLVPIMTRHRHACLTWAQQEGCPRSQCSLNVPANERCCPQFGNCELQNVANYVGILDATPRWIPTNLTLFEDHPLFERDYNLCIGCTRCVRACRDLRGIEAIGFVYDENGQVQIGTLAKTLAASGCKFCTACVEVCPTGALADKGVEAGIREKDIVYCKAACPVYMDIPAYVRKIAQGKADEANAIIKEKVPFPGVLGRVCIHPCEAVCRRGEVKAPISICALKRYAVDRDKGRWRKTSRLAAATGKKVAVVGAGPAGLTAAFYLRKQGHAVSIFDSNSKPGGMMRYGIPAYRLPRDILDREIKDILDLGIEFKPSQSLGKDVTLEQLKADGFEAVFLSVRAEQSRRISLDGCNTPDVLWGVEFLRRAAASIDKALGGTGGIDEVLFPQGTPDPHLGRDEGFASWARVDVPKLDVATRLNGFQEVAVGYSDAQAVREAKRCLQCDLRFLIRRNPTPPGDWLPFDQAHIQRVPADEGVFWLLDTDHHVLLIKGTANLRQELLRNLAENERAVLFEYEKDKIYTQRESELIQNYLQKNGEMPGGGGDDLDELF